MLRTRIPHRTQSFQHSSRWNRRYASRTNTASKRPANPKPATQMPKETATTTRTTRPPPSNSTTTSKPPPRARSHSISVAAAAARAGRPLLPPKSPHTFPISPTGPGGPWARARLPPDFDVDAIRKTPAYKSKARKITLAMMTAPVAIYVSWVLAARLWFGREQLVRPTAKAKMLEEQAREEDEGNIKALFKSS